MPFSRLYTPVSTHLSQLCILVSIHPAQISMLVSDRDVWGTAKVLHKFAAPCLDQEHLEGTIRVHRDCHATRDGVDL